VVAAVIERDGRYLLTQRKASASFPLKWEFPGGRVESGETDEEALAREIQGRIGVGILVANRLTEKVHEYGVYEVHLVMYACTLEEGHEPEARQVNDLRWVTSREFLDYEFPPADEKSLVELLGLMRN
jgi:8-oxo-dGTP diphosphatase